MMSDAGTCLADGAVSQWEGDRESNATAIMTRTTALQKKHEAGMKSNGIWGSCYVR